MLEVFPIGSRVIIPGADLVQGYITAIIIQQNNSVKYQVGYYFNNQYCEHTLNDFEFAVKDSVDVQPIGFRK